MAFFAAEITAIHARIAVFGYDNRAVAVTMFSQFCFIGGHKGAALFMHFVVAICLCFVVYKVSRHILSCWEALISSIAMAKRNFLSERGFFLSQRAYFLSQFKLDGRKNGSQGNRRSSGELLWFHVRHFFACISHQTVNKICRTASDSPGIFMTVIPD